MYNYVQLKKRTECLQFIIIIIIIIIVHKIGHDIYYMYPNINTFTTLPKCNVRLHSGWQKTSTSKKKRTKGQLPRPWKQAWNAKYAAENMFNDSISVP
jgi:hypothetical protein